MHWPEVTLKLDESVINDELDGEEVKAPPWEVLAQQQIDSSFNRPIGPDSVEEGDVLALLDRVELDEDFTRKVYVYVQDSYSIYLYDEDGFLID